MSEEKQMLLQEQINKIEDVSPHSTNNFKEKIWMTRRIS